MTTGVSGSETQTLLSQGNDHYRRLGNAILESTNTDNANQISSMNITISPRLAPNNTMINAYSGRLSIRFPTANIRINGTIRNNQTVGSNQFNSGDFLIRVTGTTVKP